MKNEFKQIQAALSCCVYKIAPVVSRLALRHVWVGAMVALVSALCSTTRAEDSQAALKPSSNEETKVELYYYIEYKVADTSSPASVRPVNGGSLGSGTASADSPWLNSSVSKLEDEVSVNRAYPIPPIVGSNVAQYKIHLVVPEGFEVFHRVAGSSGSFLPGSVLDDQTGYEVAVMPQERAGALPGKTTSNDTTDAHMRIALGFLSNGKSAGFIDFTPKLEMVKTVKEDVYVTYGRPLSAADLYSVSLSDEVTVVNLTVPRYDAPVPGNFTRIQPEAKGLRQIIAPQAIVDVVRDGFDQVLKFYTPAQRGSRITSEIDPYGNGSGMINYGSGPAPYNLSGDPYLTYRIRFTANLSKTTPGMLDFEKDCLITNTFTITRTEGSDVKVATVVQKEFFTAYLPHVRSRIIECPTCDGDGKFRCTACYGTGHVDCEECNGFGTILCEVCYGSGSAKCEDCKGKGSVECIDCFGRGGLECYDCDGYGDIECPDCEGKTIVECTDCDGGGHVECLDCGGSTIVDCDTCDGTGKVDDPDEIDGPQIDCSDCGGEGVVPCESCQETGEVPCTTCKTSGYVPCTTCKASGYVPCTTCKASGELPCNTCKSSGEVSCSTCKASGEVPCIPCNKRGYFTCTNCHGKGNIPCDICKETGWETCSDCRGLGVTQDIEYFDASVDYAIGPDYEVTGFGSNYVTLTYSPPEDSSVIYASNYFDPTGWGTGTNQWSRVISGSDCAYSIRLSQAFDRPRRELVDNSAGSFAWTQYDDGLTQRLKVVYDGATNGPATRFSYYVGDYNDSAFNDTHYGRMKWRLGSDGGWTMYDYVGSVESLGLVAKTVSPYLDARMPALPQPGQPGYGFRNVPAPQPGGDDPEDPPVIGGGGFVVAGYDLDVEMPLRIPTATSAEGYKITTLTYAADWEGVKRLPDTVTQTANGQQVGYTDNDYATGTANGQPLWITTSKTYTSSSASLTSISKVYEGLNVASWLRGLPYSSEGPDGSKETVAYHRGTYAVGTKTFTPSSTGLGFRSVVFKGRAGSTSGGTQLTSYGEGANAVAIDSIYMIPKVSTAEVTIRDDRAFTVRSETLLYTASGWVTIDSSDMQYDTAGNLTRREKLNGALYEATYTSGQKTYEKDEQGLTTSFYYDTKGRVWYTVREALSGVPAIKTSFTYDNENRVLSTMVGEADSEHIISSKTYDRSGRVLTETTEGLTTTYAYTVEAGTLTKTTITLPGGATRILENFRDGRPKSVTGTAGIAEYYTYAVETGGVETVTKRIGSETSARWSKSYSDWAGRTVKTETSTTGTDGKFTSTSVYNDLGQLATSTAAPLAPVSYTYDGNGVMNSYSQADRKHAFNYGYCQSEHGDVWSRYGGDTATWWDYSETLAFPTNATDSQVQTRTWTRVTNFAHVSRPPGVIGTAIAESVAADANDNRAVTQTFLDRATGTLTTVVWSPFAAQPSISKAVAGRMVSQTSSAGVTVSYGYDALGRPVSTTDRTGTSNVDYYANTTRLHTVTDARNVLQHTYTYDSATGRLTQDQTPKIVDGTTSGTYASTFAYNDRGQLVLVSGDVPYPVKYEYDDVYGDRLAQYTYRDAGQIGTTSGDKTAFAYYASNGLLNTKTDAANKTVSYTYNPRGQLETRTWARAVTTTYAYADNTTGELLSATYSDGTPTISYTYDRLGRLKTVQDATGDRTFTYRTADLKPEAELFGRLNATATNHCLGTTRQLTNRYEAGTGRFTGFSLDNNGSSEHALAYGFDPVNARLKTISSGAGSFSYSYLANSNLISSMTRGSFAQSRQYETDRNVLRSLATSSQAGTLAGYTYACDDLGRRQSVEQTGLVYAPYVVAEIMKTVYGYDQRNEVTSAVTKSGATTLPGRSFGYAFDPIGNRTQDSLDGNANSYETNKLNQYDRRATPSYLPVSGTANHTGGASLTINTTETPAWTNNYFYKSINKASTGTASYQSVSFTATASGMTQTETVGSMVRPINEAFTYDLDGNLTSDSLWTYRYDAENRLYEMHAKVAQSPSLPLALRFRYDYMGRRVVKEVYTYSGSPDAPTGYTLQSKTLYAYQGWTLLAEFSSSTLQPFSLSRRFTFGIDLSGSLGGAGDIGGLLAVEDLRTTVVGGVPSPRGTYLAVHDGNGNLMALAEGDTGALAAAYEYDPFGNVLRATGRYGKDNPFRFAGKYFDTETGLSYYGFRYYCASTGRFVNRDPLEEKGGWNLYSALKFGASNPFAGASGTEGTSWSTEWEQAQDRQLANTSLPHTTQAISFDSKKNSGLPGSSSADQKTYTANATGHYAQGGAPGTGPQAPSMSAGNPAAGNADINLYCYAGNNPVNSFDAMGLFLGTNLRAGEFFSALGSGLADGAYDVAMAFRSAAEAPGAIAGYMSVNGVGKTLHEAHDQITTNLADGYMMGRDSSLSELAADAKGVGSMYLNDHEFRQGVTEGFAGTGITIGTTAALKPVTTALSNTVRAVFTDVTTTIEAEASPGVGMTREQRWQQLAREGNLSKQETEHINRHGGKGMQEKFGKELAHQPKQSAAQGNGYEKAVPKTSADHRGIQHRYLKERTTGTTISRPKNPGRTGGKLDLPPAGSLP